MCALKPVVVTARSGVPVQACLRNHTAAHGILAWEGLVQPEIEDEKAAASSTGRQPVWKSKGVRKKEEE